MVTFRIVENAPPRYLEKYDEFVELYNDESYTVKEVMDKLDWSHRIFEQAKKQALDEGLIKLRKPYDRGVRRMRKIYKYYSFDKCSGKFAVKKSIFNENTGVSEVVYYGLYANEEVVKRVVDELKKVDWDKGRLEDIKCRVKEEFGLENL